MKGKSKDPVMVSLKLVRGHQMLGFFYFLVFFSYSWNQVSRQTVCLDLSEWGFRYYVVHSKRIFSFNTFLLWLTQVAVKLLFAEAFSISYFYRVLYLVKSFTPVEHSCKMQVAQIKHGRCALHRAALGSNEKVTSFLSHPYWWHLRDFCDNLVSEACYCTWK